MSSLFGRALCAVGLHKWRARGGFGLVGWSYRFDDCDDHNWVCFRCHRQDRALDERQRALALLDAPAPTGKAPVGALSEAESTGPAPAASVHSASRNSLPPASAWSLGPNGRRVFEGSKAESRNGLERKDWLP